ncbi:uncharacterized protein [Coffea arabica]|uniref:Reverse transcriptase domain-containing protein n=1 Tax=Coffea arabica TaxID=13443 RepID=A0A6P6T294_COFAR
MDASRFDWIRQRLGFDGCCPTNDGRLVVFYSSEFSCSIVCQSSQYLALRVTHSQMSTEVVGVFVHAACSVSDRRELWADLRALQVLGLPLLFHGDFNDLDLTDVGFSGNQFTWCNNRQGRARVWKRLDRVLVDRDWLGSGVVPSVHHLARTASDHSPLLVSYLISSSSSPRSFRFQDVWLRHASFKGVVQEAWLSGSTGRPMRRFLHKLKAVKAALTVWNKNVFGNVFDAVKQAEEEVAQLEAEAAARPSPEVDLWLVQASSVLKEALLRQAIFWRQKSRLRWLKEGDANSKFFHSYVRQRRVKVRIHRLQTSSGAWTDDVGSIHAMAETFFSDLFTQGPLDQVTGDELSRIPTILSEDDILDLERLPTAEEVRGAVFSLDRDSCSGPDGFPGSFYQACWDIIGGDLSDAVADFFVGADLPCGISATLLALIPKQSAPKTFADFRPISLCNFSNKIISKILAARLEKVLPRLISPQQSGFVKGRAISDNILLAQEMISRIGRKVRGSNVVLKLDMAKAYDRVSWMFLLSVMRKFGFGEVWLDMVWHLVSSCHFSVLINGGPVGFFRSTRGLRQGDPLSPALFIIMAEFLSRGLESLPLSSGFIPYSVPSGGSPPVHLGYADDVIIFCNGGRASVRKVMGVLTDYQRVSGQLVNASKSCCLLSKKVSGLRSRRVAEETGFARKSLPITYLGCPLYEGRRSKSLFAGIIDKVQARLLSWQNRWLSMGARLILIRHVLTSIPVHLLAVLEPTRGAIWEIERMFARFFLGDNHFHWCGWSKVCFPVEEGGLGVRSLQSISKAFSCKLWWRFHQQDSLWVRFLSSLYLRGGHPNQVVVGPPRSAICQRLFQVREQMELQIRWDVSLGDCYFWWDNWSCLGPLGWRFPDLSSDQKVSDFCVQGSWDWVCLSSFLPTEILEVMGETFMCFGDLPDQPCWQLASSGSFSTASAYQLVRRAGVKSLVFRSLWDSSIPLKVSCFAWRLFSGRLPLDDVLRTRCRFAGPSQCPLCLAAQETADHLFSSCLVAQAVWSFFEYRLGIPMASCGYRTRCMTWWSQPVSKMSIWWLYRILSLIILWFLWKTSNKWRFDGIKWYVQTLCYSISHELWLICSVKFPGRSLPPEFGGLVSAISGIQRPLSSTLVSWEFPQNGFVKLNTDGSSSSTAGASGIGGILRRSDGSFLGAFAAKLPLVDSLQAEAYAMLHGLQLCQQMGFSMVQVESDSQVLVRVVAGSFSIPWAVRPLIRAIRAILPLGVRLSHCFREANTVADSLAAVGVACSGHLDYPTLSSLPRLSRSFFVLDREQLLVLWLFLNKRAYCPSARYDWQFKKKKIGDKENYVVKLRLIQESMLRLLLYIAVDSFLWKILKEIMTKKRKLEDYETIALTEECNAIIQNKLPPKLKYPRSFFIPYTIGMQEKEVEEMAKYLDVQVPYKRGNSYESLGVSKELPSPSEEQAPRFEFKPFPKHLKYAFLRENETLPVIVNAELNMEQLEKFLRVLKKYLRAIGWTISDIKGISPMICMH